MWLHTALALTVAQWSEHSPRLSSGLAPRFPQAFARVSVVPDLVNSLTGSQYWGVGEGVESGQKRSGGQGQRAFCSCCKVQVGRPQAGILFQPLLASPCTQVAPHLWAEGQGPTHSVFVLDAFSLETHTYYLLGKVTHNPKTKQNKTKTAQIQPVKKIQGEDLQL